MDSDTRALYHLDEKMDACAESLHLVLGNDIGFVLLAFRGRQFLYRSNTDRNKIVRALRDAADSLEMQNRSRSN